VGAAVHTSRISITRERGPVRKALIEGLAEPVFYGIHGGIQKCSIGATPWRKHAATLDHIVGAAAG